MKNELLREDGTAGPFLMDLAARDLIYWKSKLGGAVSDLPLPYDFAQPSSPVFEPETYKFTIPAVVLQKVTGLANEEKVSVFEVLMAVYVTLIHRYSGEEAVTVGTETIEKHGDSASGLSIKTLAIRTDIEEGATFRQMLSSVSKTLAEASRHQNVPFSTLIKEMKEDTSLRENPFFQVMISMNHFHPEKKEMDFMLEKKARSESQFTKVDLNLFFTKGTTELTASVLYNKHMFKQETIARVAAHFSNLLQAAMVNRESKITALPMLTAEEAHTLLVDWNKGKSEYPRDASIPQLFEEQVRLFPEKTALVYGNGSMSYQKLNERADQIANHLIMRGIKPEQLVGISLDRSFDMIASFLGVLKAGGAYVPFDLSYPAERIAYMMEDSQASFVITTAGNAVRLPHTEAEIIRLDEDKELINAAPSVTNVYSSNPDQLAYVMYTSGSTGKPKGVAIIHRGVARLVKNITYAEAGPEEVSLNLAQVAFDLSVYEIYGALLNGGKLVLMESNKPVFEEIAKAIKKNRVTSLCVTPDRLNVLLEDFSGSLGSLRQVLSAGEALPAWLAHKCLTVLKSCKLINLYGPTENSVTTTSYHVKEVLPNASSVSIGRPIANDSVYILDEHLQPVPIGVIGELYLAGDGIARGYLNKPELTEERFPLNPFIDHGEKRMYKSGDLARYRPDGNIEFIRRADDQVKIRGFRIELGEIETVIGLFPGIRQSVTGTTKGKDGTTELVSYVVMSKGTVFNHQLIRSYVQERLPQHMVPTFFVELEKMPVTPVGKIDRKKLPAPVVSASHQLFTAPENKTEEILTQLWEELLDVRPIGTSHHFFELGGNSLIAMRMLAEVEKKFDKRLPVTLMFQEDTIAGLAKHLLSEEQVRKDTLSLVPIQPLGAKPPLFCIHGGGGEVFIYRGIAAGLGEDQPVYGLRYAEDEAGHSISVASLADKYLKEIREIQKEGPYSLLGFCFGGVIAYEMAQKLTQDRETVSLLTILNFGNPVHKPVEDPYQLSYKMLVRKNLKQLANMPLNHQASFLVKKVRNAFKLVYQNPVPVPAGPAPVTKASLTKAIKSYRPVPYAGKVLLIRATASNADDPLGWETTAGGRIYMHNIPAEHETLMKEPYIEQVTDCLKKHL